MNVKKEVIAFIAVAFLLLGALFGVQIMSFIFSSLDNSAETSFPPTTETVTNRSGAYINETTYTIPEAAAATFGGDFTVVIAINGTGGEVLTAGNYTVDASQGTLINASAIVYDVVNLTYTYSLKGQPLVSIENVGENSLVSVETYSEQADTQMRTVAITITLLILIALFAIFWKLFISKRGEKFG